MKTAVFFQLVLWISYSAICTVNVMRRRNVVAVGTEMFALFLLAKSSDVDRAIKLNNMFFLKLKKIKLLDNGVNQ